MCSLAFPQSEREAAEARFTKLKLQAKAKMATLNKQIADLKGQDESTVSLITVFTFSCSIVTEMNTSDGFGKGNSLVTMELIYS